MNTEPQPYRQAPPQMVLAFMAGLAVASGNAPMFEACIVQLATMLAVPRVPACQGQR